MYLANIDTAKEIAKDLYPLARNISFIERGHDNLVILIDEDYALRFPINDNAYIRSQYEKQILLQLPSPEHIRIPRILGEGQNPPYLVTSFLHGKHLSPAEINKLSATKQKKIAQQVARFAYFLHTSLPIEKIMGLRKQLRLDELADEPWETTFEKFLVTSTLPTRKQDDLAKEYFNRWKSLTLSTPAVVVHDDLHTENMMFEDGKLTGILDFGDTNIGSPEQDLRQLYRINETILKTAIQAYEQLSGHKLNIESAKVWAITQELAVFSELSLSRKTNHPAFLRAARNLNTWLPEGNWHDGINARSITSTKQ